MNLLERATSAFKAASFGWSSQAFQDAIVPSADRGNYMFLLPQDSVNYIGSWTRAMVDRKVEWLWQNFGIVKQGVAGIARHAVGKGISLQIDSEDYDWTRLVEDDFEQFALSPDRCDASGRRNFYEAQTFAIETRIFRGEFFAAHADNPRWKGAPCFQIIDGSRVTGPDNGEKNIYDGIRLDELNAPVEYFVATAGGQVKPIPANMMVHWYKPHGVDQVRGVSDLAQAVNRLVDIHELTRVATKCGKAQGLVTMMMKGVTKKKTRGAFGALKSAGGHGTRAEGGKNEDDHEREKTTAQLEKIYGEAGAGIAYLDADGDIKMVEKQIALSLVEPFITDLLMRDVCAGWGVDAEFFWAVANMNGVNSRFIMTKADLFFQIMADALVYRFCNPIAYRYIQSRIQSGAIPAPKDPNWKISWQFPARITVDNGRDGVLKITRLANGAMNLQMFYSELGMNWMPATKQWFREFRYAKKCAEDEGVPEAMALWRAAMPGAAGSGAAQGYETAAAASDKSKKEKKDNPDHDDEDA